MVLSNKKLKQKFRSLLAESIATAESKNSHKDSLQAADVSGELQGIKEILSSKSRKKPKSPNPEKRRKKRPLGKNPKASEGSEETQKRNGDSAVKEEEKKTKKKQKKKKKKVNEEEEENGEIEKGRESRKRKREDEGEQGLNEKKNKEKKKKTENKVKVKEGNNEKEGENIEKASEIVETERSEKTVEEPIKFNQSETKKLYVGGIPYYSSEDDIRSFFEGCGTVTEVDCMTFPESGKFRGIAILTFKTEAAAKRALALDGADMGGFYLKIQPYKVQRTQKPEFAPKIVEGYNRVYVGNLSWDLTEGDLKQLFSDCKVSSIRFGTDKDTGDFKGYAHVDFADTVSLTIGLKLDQKVVCGRPVRISCAVQMKGAEVNAQEKPAANLGENDGTSGSSKKGENDGTSGSSKKKRRTCYVCGVPGHLSSACPRKKAAVDDDSSVES